MKGHAHRLRWLGLRVYSSTCVFQCEGGCAARNRCCTRVTTSAPPGVCRGVDPGPDLDSDTRHAQIATCTRSTFSTSTSTSTGSVRSVRPQLRPRPRPRPSPDSDSDPEPDYDSNPNTDLTLIADTAPTPTHFSVCAAALLAPFLCFCRSSSVEEQKCFILSTSFLQI